MIEVLKAYLQVASGVGELTRQRAVEVARQALAGTPAAMVLPVASAGVEGLTAQASALADELMAASRQNREQLTQLVRAEVDSVLTRLGLGGNGAAELEAELAISRARVRELERQVSAAPSPRTAVRERPSARRTAKKTAAAETTAKTTKSTPKSTAKSTPKRAAKGTSAKRTTTKRTTTKGTAKAAGTRPASA